MDYEEIKHKLNVISETKMSNEYRERVMAAIDQAVQTPLPKNKKSVYNPANAPVWLGTIAVVLLAIGLLSPWRTAIPYHPSAFGSHQGMANSSNGSTDNDGINMTATQRAIRSVLMSSVWGDLFIHYFPHHPGSIHSTIPMGSRLSGSKQVKFPATCVTEVSPDGHHTLVRFIESWGGGEYKHYWTFVVNLNGRIISHSQFGPNPPQF